MKIFLKALFIMVLILFTACRENIVEPVDKSIQGLPVADAGESQIINVGSYFVLNAGNSKRGSGDTLYYHWTESSLNPSKIFDGQHNPNKKIINAAVYKEGKYRFNLTVNNGEEERSDDVIITVFPKENFIITDPVIETQIRYRLKAQIRDLFIPDFLEIDSLYNYNLSKEKAKRLGGLGHCENLVWLNLPNEEISDVDPISRNIDLEWINLGGNKNITDVTPLKTLVKLKHIDLSDNKISTIEPLRALSSIEYLNVADNLLKEVLVAGDYMQLKTLIISGNPIENLSIYSEQNYNLDRLEAEHCVITDISDLTKTPDLSILKLAHNKISEISALTQVNKIQVLELQSNQISDITPLINQENIKIMNLASNNIEDIKPLADNSKIRSGASIILEGNPLNEKSINEYIPELEKRGVIVAY